MDKLLNQFLAVAEAGTISGAATALFVTQPTLTFNMRKLEETLDVPLFTRSSRGVRLTRYGETLYENALLMRRLYDNTLSSIEKQRINAEQGLSIGSGYSWWTLFIKDMVVDYGKAFPNAPIHVSLGNQLRCMDQLLSGDISLFVAHEIEGLNRRTGTHFIPLGRVGQGYFVRADHPLLAAPRSLAEIEAYPAVTSSPTETRHQRFFEDWGRMGSVNSIFDQSKYTFASNSLAACLDFVGETDAVLGHTQVMAAEFIRRGLCEVTVTEPTRQSTIGIYTMAERADEPRVAGLIERLCAAATAILPPPAP